MAEYSDDELRPNTNNRAEYRNEPTQEEPEGETRERRLQREHGGRTMKMKRSIKDRLLETFIDEEFTKDGLKRFIIKDIIVPAVQDALMDSVNGALGMMFGIGIVRKGSGGKTSSSGKIRYGGYFNSDSSSSRRSESRRDSDEPKRSKLRSRPGEFEPQMKDSRFEAEDIKKDLEDALNEYGEVSVFDYYDAFGISTDPVDDKWGWTDLKDMYVKRISRAFYDEDKRRYVDGWALIMPTPHAL